MSLATDTKIAGNPKLPFWDTVSHSYSTYFGNFLDVLRISWLWLLVITPLTGGATWLQMSWFAGVVANLKQGTIPSISLQKASMPIEITILANAANLAFILAGTSIAVAWHRRLILDEHPQLSGMNVATKNLWRYVGMGLVICLIVAIPVGLIVATVFFLAGPLPGTGMSRSLPPAFAMLVPVIFVINLAITFIILRLMLLLPARAVGDLSLTFKQAWTRTRGNTWRLFWGIIACILPPGLIMQIAFIGFLLLPSSDATLNEALPTRFAIIYSISMAYYLLILPILIGFMSHAYRHFFRQT